MAGGALDYNTISNLVKTEYPTWPPAPVSAGFRLKKLVGMEIAIQNLGFANG